MAYINGNQIYFGVVGTRSGSDVNVVQETGQSTANVMSQKAVTDNLNKKINVAEYSAIAHVVEKDNGINSSFIKRTTGGTADIADGVATVKSIKGNTIVWNQFVKPLNNEWSCLHATVSYSDNIATITATQQYGAISTAIPARPVSGHKYLFYHAIKPSSSLSVNQVTVMWNNGVTEIGIRLVSYPAGVWTTAAQIITAPSEGTTSRIYVYDNRASGWDAFEIKNIMLIDLTKMFGAGNEPSTVAEFKALFPKDYYAYDAGSLLSFVGNGIKTVGYNLYNGTTANVISGQEYYISGSYSELNLNDEEITPVNGLFTPQTSGDLFVFGGGADTCISLSSTRNGEYDDYWTITQNIPIAKYFPNGMRKVGEICDELTANKAIKRIGSRTYQSGDENDNAVITDGNNTFYVLTDPTVVVIGSPINLSYSVAKYGTEEITTTDNEMTSPCNMIIAYSVNLPKDYISKKSFDEFCAALEAALNCTITATWDDINGKYTYTIVI